MCDRPEPYRVDQFPHQSHVPDRTPSDSRPAPLGGDPNGFAQSLVEALAKKPLARDRLVAAIRAMDAASSGEALSSGPHGGSDEGDVGDAEGDRWGVQPDLQAELPTEWRARPQGTRNAAAPGDHQTRPQRRCDRLAAAEPALC
jgi:hypothetical protein